MTKRDFVYIGNIADLKDALDAVANYIASTQNKEQLQGWLEYVYAKATAEMDERKVKP